MSSTRHASADAPLAQGRYMSSPQYAELRGLCGSAVAAKVAILDDPRARSLVLFLDALSRRPGGLKKVAADLLATFPERIGTPSMHKFGVRPGQIYNAGQVKIVRQEVEQGFGRRNPRSPLAPPTEEEFERLGARIAEDAELARGGDLKSCYSGKFPIKGDDRNQQAEYPSSYPAAVFIEGCRRKLADCIEPFLTDLCINPEHSLVDCYFHDSLGALLEFKSRYEQAAAARIAETEITSAVSRTLSRGLRSRKIVIANGVAGIGKSFSGESFCEQHLGEARFIQLTGIVTKTTFFNSISEACGLASGVQQKSQEMQTRIERYLERSGIMLVIDEAHRCFSQTKRMSAHPEMLNWIYTLWDMGIPVALLVTPQFITLMDHAETETGWNSGQFKRRVEKWEQLPTRIGEEDLRAVACKLAPRYSKGMIDELVDFALPSRRQLDALKRALSAAQEFAAEAGRETPNARDLDEGIKDAQATDLALTTPLDRERQSRGNGSMPLRRGRGRPPAVLPQAPSDTAAEPLPFDGDTEDFADSEPSAPPTETRITAPRGARPISAAV